MAFWGVEVKPGKPFTHFFDRVRGRLHISQATLGNGSASKKCIVQCNVGNKSPVLLCALLPDKNESCALALEFEEVEDVIFSVVGPRSVYLTGYYLGGLQNSKFDDDTESYGEDIANTDMEESNRSGDEDEYEDSFIDDNDPEVIPPSPVSDCGETYKDGEEVEDEKPRKEKGQNRLKKKHHMSDSDDDDNAPKSKVINRRSRTIISDSDDEDRLPISSLSKTENTGNSKKVEPEREGEKKVGTETNKDDNHGAELGPEVNGYLKNGDRQRQSELVSAEKESKSKKKRKECSKEKIIGKEAIKGDEVDWRSGNEQGDDLLPTEVTNDGPKPKKRRKECSKKTEILQAEADSACLSKVLIKDKEGSDTTKDDNIINDQPLKNKNDLKSESVQRSEDCTNQITNGKRHEEKRDKKKKKAKAEENDQENKTKLPISVVRILSNGMEIEELDMGNPESKVATKGKKVKITFTGRLVVGNVFDSNENSVPYKFRLGAGKVIEGWDIGIEGMRVGGRRRLKIPPSLGFGSEGHGENIPPNSWVIYDIELVGVH